MRTSLLRYPGGKAKIFPLIERLTQEYNLASRIYTEPFAGGFGIGLKAMSKKLFGGYIINDCDYHIYALWFCIFNETNSFINRIVATDINLMEWQKQKNIYNNPMENSILDVGFSTFFLNRTNYSGIIKGGPIGGFAQSGNYKLDCRFNKDELIKQIEYIGGFRKSVEVFNLDAIDFINKIIIPLTDKLFVNFDPPYVEKGAGLYTNYLKDEDHIFLQRHISSLPKDSQWMMTYDDCELVRELYYSYKPEKISLKYSAGVTKEGKELLITHLHH